MSHSPEAHHTRHRPGPTRGTPALLATLILFLTLVSIETPQPAQAACTETHKFVKEPYHTFVAGNMSVLTAQNNSRSVCSELAVFHTVFIDLSGGRQTSFVEAGLTEPASAPGYSILYWAWQLPGQSEVYGTCGSPQCDPYVTGDHVSFNVTPTTGLATTWKMQYANGSSETGWVTFHTTPNLNQYAGIAEGEVSKYGTSGAGHNQFGLKYRPTTGGWSNWAGLDCDTAHSDMNDWDAVRDAATAWHTVHRPPAPAC